MQYITPKDKNMGPDHTLGGHQYVLHMSEIKGKMLDISQSQKPLLDTLVHRRGEHTLNCHLKMSTHTYYSEDDLCVSGSRVTVRHIKRRFV